ncbi:NlpC/P60 family protein [Prauserella sp. PE36]|uniref:NlpC/P60 family protein n=1 Tax=Prauserella sp. PE36 TaxID=1504709 RepID=UPI000DE39A75|nr:NlpC/P60 family protein [Prauserella sp. PE36]RBM18120.1 NlpC/P60 family protein [Prauserella sp. PE36]
MRSALRLGVAVLSVPVLALLFLLLAVSGSEQPPALAAGQMCAVGPAPDGSVAGYGGESLEIAAAIVVIGKQRKLPPIAWQIATQAGMAESGLRNLNYGDRDSLGIFQMRPSMGWGTPQQLQDVEYQVRKFYEVLVTVPGWERMRPGEAAQAVERSAFPERYHAFEVAARQVLGAVQGIECLEASPTATAGVITAAMEQIGVRYAWGGGDLDGPSSGTGIDAGVVGFDCSSLVRFAYHRGTGGKVTLPRTSREQYQATKGLQVPVDQLAKGDLLFYGSSPGSIHHVALYAGNDQMIEAPESGKTVRTTPVRLGGDFFAATRVLTRGQ